MDKDNTDERRNGMSEDKEQKRGVKLNFNQVFELRNLVDIHLRGFKEEIANGERDADDIDYLDLRDVRGQLNSCMIAWEAERMFAEHAKKEGGTS